MASPKPLDTGWLSSTKDLFRYVWRTSARAQLLLTVLAIIVFLLELAPLELQRRIVNTAVEAQSYHMIGLLCALYLVVALLQGGLKLVLNIYRGRVIETACQRLRLEPKLVAVTTSDKEARPKEQGVAISVVTSEVDAVGGFLGVSFSDLVLNGGILLSVFGYMLFLEPWMAAVALALFIPQVLFIPILQKAINRRTAKRIKTVRGIAVDLVDTTNGNGKRRETTYRRRVGDVYELNMQIYRRKFAMTFLMNMLYQLGTIGILFVGGWLLLRGETEVGTVVAFISGLTRTSDPWNDLVDYFRNLTNAGVKYQLIEQVIGEPGGAAA